MLHTYEALLRGDRLEWIGPIPEESAKADALPVRVTILRGEPGSEAQRAGRKMAQALEEIALSDPPAQIKDPVGWQRELRRDRSLVGRSD